MIVRIAAATLALVLVVAYLVPVVVKLKEVALGVLILVGLAMMVVDMWQTLRDKDV